MANDLGTPSSIEDILSREVLYRVSSYVPRALRAISCTPERQLELSEKSVRAAQEMAHISKQNYADRLLAAIQQSTRTDAADA